MQKLLPFLKTSGILLPLASLTSADDLGCGDLSSAYKFVDFLERSGMSVWKMLPINEMSGGTNNSPYDSSSAFALDYLYLNIYQLEHIDLSEFANSINECKAKAKHEKGIDYDALRLFKALLLHHSFESFYEENTENQTDEWKAFQQYIADQSYWINEYALHKLLRKVLAKEGSTDTWPISVISKDQSVLDTYRKAHHEEILYYQYVQWIMHEQWMKFKTYANELGIYLVGDVPIYVDTRSADVWSHPLVFQVDSTLTPKALAGAPPDTFSKSGQSWKLTLYDWENQYDECLAWWTQRLTHVSTYFDGLRLDHFRGFIKYWAIPVNKKPAEGRWEKGPGYRFLNTITKLLQDTNRISVNVEDLGFITKDVEHTRDNLGLGGSVVYSMHTAKVMSNSITYPNFAQTTIHDSPPLGSLWKKMNARRKIALLKKLGEQVSDEKVLSLSDETRWHIIEELYKRPFSSVIIPMQDILGEEARINTPTFLSISWKYRMSRSIESLLSDSPLIEKLQTLAKIYKRDRFFETFTATSIPPIDERVVRTYAPDESIHLWVFSEFENTILAKTNLPYMKDKHKALHHIPFTLIEKTPQGYLYHLELRSTIPGRYFCNIEIGNNSIAPHIPGMTIIIKDSRSAWQRMFLRP
jgi:4-alpha-glucanotransferase